MGAKRTTVPKPQMSNEPYNEEWVPSSSFRSVVAEFEPVFDAAEFCRFGRDIFYQHSQVANEFGIEWLRRHLEEDYSIHVLHFKDENAMHTDGAFAPLMPEKLLGNPHRPCATGKVVKIYSYNDSKCEYRLPETFKDWEVLLAPTPELPASHPLYFTSPWVATCNVLVLSAGKFILEATGKEAIRVFKSWGFAVVDVPFRNFMAVGGSFHCATCAVRRRGTLGSYFLK